MSGVSRRQVLKAAAWTVPAVVVAVGTPALAASDVCGDETFFHPGDPASEWDAVRITVRTGHFVEAVFLRDYPHATALNINGQVVHKLDGASVGDVFFADLAVLGVCDPTFIQVDGTDIHYYGNGVFK